MDFFSAQPLEHCRNIPVHYGSKMWKVLLKNYLPISLSQCAMLRLHPTTHFCDVTNLNA